MDIDAAVPGMFRRMALISPPETPPMNIPIIMAIPFTWSSTNVSGRQRHTAIAVFSPGSAPKMIPKRVPAPMSRRLVGLSRDTKP